MQLMEHWDNMAKFALLNEKSGGLRFELSATCQYGTEVHHIMNCYSSLFGY